MRAVVLLVALVVATMPGRTPVSQERQPDRPDGIYVTVEAVTGAAIASSPVFDAVIMAESAPMKQYKGVTHIAETFDANVTQVAVLAESYEGEVSLGVIAIKNGRVEFGKGAQGKQVVCHFNAWGTPYFAVFPRR